ncbi:hypothetical protein EVAR_77273_1 [Eumeta japonica]|uniref:RING-type E3 ubiquitin transferase n=1 Tax=Eumeta variegata TaxID=151549 RepID=A0A4C1ULQ9_EUMVA|nr:hypothetical protein EVAR_77273_1 [Eumeta japonica]
MSDTYWKKIENEAGYPCYLGENSKKESFDHPKFQRITESLQEYNAIKYSAYRVAFKIHALQKELKVPPLRISTGVLTRHQLSLSESSLSLDTTELEAVLADIYFAAEKEGIFNGDVDLAVDLLINLLLNVYDRERKQPIRVLAAKILLIVLSDEKCGDKWVALANCAADHNGCVSSRRLTNLLSLLTALPVYLGEENCDQNVQADLDESFSKSVGMLGVSAQYVADWALFNCSTTRWLPVVSRITASRGVPGYQTNAICAKCSESLAQIKPPECYGFMKSVRRIFFCTKTRKKGLKKPTKKKLIDPINVVEKPNIEAEKPIIFTSTVGKASGNKNSNPAVLLEDIITQLEKQNRAFQDLSQQVESTKKGAQDNLQAKLDAHRNQIAAQINRLKLLNENLRSSQNKDPVMEANRLSKKDNIKAFDLFSPIPIVTDKESKVTEKLRNQPRVLSLDSGNFSVASKQTMEEQPLMTVSGDALKPVVVHATSDSISTVSMNDISTWYNDAESVALDKKINSDNDSKGNIGVMNTRSNSLCVTEERFDADLRSVASSNDKMKELNADLDTVLDRLQQILSNNFAMDDSCFDNTQLKETANEMEDLLGTLIRGVEQRATLNSAKHV